MSNSYICLVLTGTSDEENKGRKLVLLAALLEPYSTEVEIGCVQ
jgi:hypothetical protein